MENNIQNSIELDKSYKKFKLASALSFILILFALPLLLEPYYLIIIYISTPIWGIMLLLVIFFSAKGILEGRKMLNENNESPKTKMSVYGNAVILVVGLVTVISICICWFSFLKWYF